VSALAGIGTQGVAPVDSCIRMSCAETMSHSGLHDLQVLSLAYHFAAPRHEVAQLHLA